MIECRDNFYESIQRIVLKLLSNNAIEKSVMTPAQIYDHVVTAYNKNPNVDAIFIQSGTMATVDIIEDLEEKTGKPVVSTNSAKIWGSFRTLNIAVGRGYGRLLSSL